LIPVTSMMKSPPHWREGIFELCHVLCALTDFALSQRDQRVVAFLFGKGHAWAGNPDDPTSTRGFGRLHMAYLSGASGVFRAVDATDTPEAQAALLGVRDKLLRGVQDLLTSDPESLYLVCLYAAKTLENKAQRLGVDTEAPDRRSPFSFIDVCAQVCERLEMVFPNLECTEDFWEERLRKATLTV